MTDKTVKDALGANFTASLNLDLGPKDKADTRVVGLSNEDKAALDLINTTLSDPATSIPHFALDATLDLTRVLVDFTSTSDQTIVSATASQTTRVHRMELWFAGAVTLSIYSGTSGGTLLRKLVIPAAGLYTLDFDPRPHFITATNNALTFDASASVNIVGYVDYVKSA